MEGLSERRTECVSVRENSVWRSVCTIQSELNGMKYEWDDELKEADL